MLDYIDECHINSLIKKYGYERTKKIIIDYINKKEIEDAKN